MGEDSDEPLALAGLILGRTSLKFAQDALCRHQAPLIVRRILPETSCRSLGRSRRAAGTRSLAFGRVLLIAHGLATERTGQRRGPAADDARFVPERIGWLPFVAPSGWAIRRCRAQECTRIDAPLSLPSVETSRRPLLRDLQALCSKLGVELLDPGVEQHGSMNGV